MEVYTGLAIFVFGFAIGEVVGINKYFIKRHEARMRRLGRRQY